MRYVGLIFGDHEGGYGFTVPDLPGFTAHAESGPMDAAVAVAERVLADHIAAMVDAGLAVPEARDVADLERDPEAREELDDADAFVLLRAVRPAGRTLRINVSIDEATLQAADADAAVRNLTRSAYFAEACRRMLFDATLPVTPEGHKASFRRLRPEA